MPHTRERVRAFVSWLKQTLKGREDDKLVPEREHVGTLHYVYVEVVRMPLKRAQVEVAHSVRDRHESSRVLKRAEAIVFRLVQTYLALHMRATWCRECCGAG